MKQFLNILAALMIACLAIGVFSMPFVVSHSFPVIFLAAGLGLMIIYGFAAIAHECKTN